MKNDDILIKNKDLFDNFKTTFLFNYLKVLRDSGIVNMWGAAKYLYMGRERIYHNEYNNPIAEDNEKYEELLEMADQAQREMVVGVMKVLESQGKEDYDVNDINRYLKVFAGKMMELYIYRFR